MIRLRHLLAPLAASLLAACASAPVHYYTLIPAPDSSPAPAVPAAGFQFELLPVGVPAQVDVPQLVVRQGGQSVALLDGERWVAPLADEVRAALSVDLAQRLNAQDIGSSSLPVDGKPVLRIKVDVQRFESSPGSYALIDATWSIRPLKGNDVLTCASHINENPGQGYAGLVAAHQQALAQLAGQIASVAPALAAGSTPPCPTP